MKRFSKIYEDSQSDQIFKISADLTLEIKAESEGEAGYLADSILGSIEDHTSFVIKNIEEISESELKLESVESPSWGEIGGHLQRQFEFDGFPEAISFINKVAKVCDEDDHHPEIINVFNKVTIKFKTHDSNSITELDHQMAKKVDDII